MKRIEGVLDWDTTFMGMAKLIAQRSKDEHTQVGAVIVGKDKRILSLGYNGMPNGLSDDEDIWNKTGDITKQKYSYVCHAEANAILNYRGSGGSLENSTIYVTLFPCNECAKMIVQSGIKEVVYENDKHNGEPLNIVSKKILDANNVTYRQMKEKIDIEIKKEPI